MHDRNCTLPRYPCYSMYVEGISTHDLKCILHNKRIHVGLLLGCKHHVNSVFRTHSTHSSMAVQSVDPGPPLCLKQNGPLNGGPSPLPSPPGCESCSAVAGPLLPHNERVSGTLSLSPWRFP